VAAALALASLGTRPAEARGEPPPPDVPARSYLLLDGDDGDILAARGADRQSSIASTTKLMTAYVARRSLRLGETVTAPAYQALAAESLLGLEAGERIRVRDLLYGLLLVSGNDAAVALAEASAGSVPSFVDRMNRAARRLGLDDTSYANPIGLDEPGNYSTARDLAELTIELRRDRIFRRIFDTAGYETRSGLRPRQLTNRNTLVLTVPWVNGVKTGHTLGAGYVLIASGERRDVELVAAVLGAPSEAARDEASLELLSYGHSLYRRERAVREGERLAAAGVRDQGLTLPLVAAADARITRREDEPLETEVRAPAELDGPIDRGERLGAVLVSVDGEEVARVPLLAARDVPEPSLLERLDATVPGSRAFRWGLALACGAALLAFGLGLRARRRGSRGLG